ncbi:uncharacterized protein [Henckelia pumila]|uniref:uncharacterized protein n=1 Tax=Henckelia pumila TaxID=405737 RepID=UPI003C6E8105
MGQRSQVGGTLPPSGMDDQDKEEMCNEIRILRQQLGGKGSTLKKESPFSLEILEEELPASFKKPSVGEYDGSTDPKEHMGRFENAALLHQYSDGTKCRVFLSTLVKFSQQWFNMLKPGSIRSFEDFRVVFMHQFYSCKKYQKKYLSLFVMKKQDQETLRDFIQRFNGVVLEVPTEVNSSTVKKPPPSYDDLLAREERYVNLEDAQRYKRTEHRPGGSTVEGADKGGRKQGLGEKEDDRARGKMHFSPYVPLAPNRDKVMEVDEGRRRQGSLQMVDEGPT